MTPFEEQVANCKRIQINGKDRPYWHFSLACHKRDLGLWSKGIKINRSFKVSDYKKFYGIKGRNGQEVLDDFMDKIWNKYITNDSRAN